MNDYGFIKLSRKIQQNWMWQQKRTFSEFERWIDLILKAHYETTPKKVYLSNGRSRTQTILQRGDVAASVRSLSEAWGVTRTSTQRYLKRLQEMDHVRVRKVTNKIHVIEILNYSKYNPTSEDLKKQNWDTNNTTVRDANDATKGDNKYKRIKEKKNIYNATQNFFPESKKLTRKQREEFKEVVKGLRRGGRTHA